jgi:hypothetical protein
MTPLLIAAAILMAPIPVDDPTPSPSVPYQVSTSDGTLLPGNQVLPPVSAHAMRACGYTLDPGTMTWRSQRGRMRLLADPPKPANNNVLASMVRPVTSAKKPEALAYNKCNRTAVRL